MKKILAFHLYNDYSGSPKVLRQTLGGLARAGYDIALCTSRGGVLDGLRGEGVDICHFNYRFSSFRPLTFLRLVRSELFMMLYGLRHGSRDSIFFVNTLLPTLAAVAGRLRGARVVYHYHENAFVKSMMYRSKAWCMKRLANEIICVSDYQKDMLNAKGNAVVLPNALPDSFRVRLTPDAEAAFMRRNVLFVGSLKIYKGILDFIDLARACPDINFTAVLSASREEIDAFVANFEVDVPSNLTMHPRQEDTVPFYNNASVVVNLSNRSMVLETFGLTIIEAMADGLPVVVPVSGGIAELVEDGKNGWHIDSQDMGRLKGTIENILNDKGLYMRLSANAISMSKKYDETQYFAKMCVIIENGCHDNGY